MGFFHVTKINLRSLNLRIKLFNFFYTFFNKENSSRHRKKAHKIIHFVVNFLKRKIKSTNKANNKKNIENQITKPFKNFLTFYSFYENKILNKFNYML